MVRSGFPSGFSDLQIVTIWADNTNNVRTILTTTSAPLRGKGSMSTWISILRLQVMSPP